MTKKKTATTPTIIGDQPASVTLESWDIGEGMVVSSFLPTGGFTVALDATMTSEQALAAINRWYGDLLAQARIEYKARRKAVLEKHQR